MELAVKIIRTTLGVVAYLTLMTSLVGLVATYMLLVA